jgi:DNA phosphorothioation-associated putative methyltransferase
METVTDTAVGEIDRHKTAIRRTGFSLPVRCLLRDGVLDTSHTLFDYGCGRGQDLEFLTEMQFSCAGWDPVHRPEGMPTPSDVVNLSYVINIIENPAERANHFFYALKTISRCHASASGSGQYIFSLGKTIGFPTST